MSSPNEIALLRAVEAMGESGKRAIGHKMGISTDYAGYMCDYLYRDGYLMKTPRGKYRLTAKGAVLLRDVLYQIHRKLSARITRSHRIRDRISERIDGLTNLTKENP